MAQDRFMFPVGRYVGGSLYKQRAVTERDGKTPKIGKDGQPRKNWSFALAIRKTGPDWKLTDWGRRIVAVGVGGYPNGETNAPAFAWKITDGDSTIPNKKGKKPCAHEGWPGHWVLWFSSEAQAPRLTDRLGTREGTLTYSDNVERIKPGHMIEVYGFIKDNAPSESPGVYLNYDIVAHNDDTTPVITLAEETDSTTLGFGGGAAPAPAPAAAPVAPPAAPPAAPTVVTPNPGMLAPPPAPGAPPAPPAGPQMTTKATATYEAYRTAGWTDAQLRENELMV